MKYRNHRTWKPDPLMALAIVVAIGVVVTTTAQADTSTMTRAESLAQLHQTGARLALQPVKGMAGNLEINWLNTVLDRPAIQQLVNDNRLELARPFGSKGLQLGMSIRPSIDKGARISGDAGVGAGQEDRPDLYFSLRKSW